MKISSYKPDDTLKSPKILLTGRPLPHLELADIGCSDAGGGHQRLVPQLDTPADVIEEAAAVAVGRGGGDRPAPGAAPALPVAHLVQTGRVQLRADLRGSRRGSGVCREAEADRRRQNGVILVGSC